MQRMLGLSLLVVSLSACSGDDDGETISTVTTATATATDTTSTTSATATATGTTASTSSTGSTTIEPTSTTGQTDSATDGTTAATTGAADDVVTLETSMGAIVVHLDPDLAPITTANFLTYVDAGFYDGEDMLGATVFHRVIEGFMIQGGGLTQDLQTKTTMAPIVNESANGLSNLRGTIAMARTNDPDSATAQFFINHADNTFLDEPPGYAVFGEVIAGMDVVDAIAMVPTGSQAPYDDVPNTPILIMDAHRGAP